MQWKLADYQFFKIYKRFERRKITHKAVNEKRKTEKSWTFFITSCFIKPFKMVINIFFYFPSTFATQFSLFFFICNKEQLGMANYNIYFQNKFNLLVMNITQINFLCWQNVHTWNLVNANHKRSLQFAVVPTLTSWNKTKFLTDYNSKIWTKNAEVYISFTCFSNISFTCCSSSLIFT